MLLMLVLLVTRSNEALVVLVELVLLALLPELLLTRVAKCFENSSLKMRRRASATVYTLGNLLLQNLRSGGGKDIFEYEIHIVISVD